MSGVARLQAREPLVGHARRVRCVALTADGRRPAAGTCDRRIFVGNVGRPV